MRMPHAQMNKIHSDVVAMLDIVEMALHVTVNIIHLTYGPALIINIYPTFPLQTLTSVLPEWMGTPRLPKGRARKKTALAKKPRLQTALAKIPRSVKYHASILCSEKNAALGKIPRSPKNRARKTALAYCARKRGSYTVLVHCAWKLRLSTVLTKIQR